MIDWTKYCTAQQSAWSGVNRIAQVEFSLMHQLRSALKNFQISPDGKKWVPAGCETYLDVVEKDYTLSFMRMGTFIRLASELEQFFRHYYMERRGLTSRSGIKDDLRSFRGNYQGAVFQRVFPSRSNGQSGLVDLYRAAFNIDLPSITGFKEVQEVFAHRHLYVHQNGLVDDQYLERIKELLGQEERLRIEADVLRTASVTQIDDAEVYWFWPINERFSKLINSAKEFVLELPPSWDVPADGGGGDD